MITISYVRYGSIYKFVEGESDNYIFLSSAPKGQKDFIEDYGSISNETIVEIIGKVLNRSEENTILKDYLLKELAKKLNVKLRETPLTDEEQIKLQLNSHKEFVENEEYKEFIKGWSKLEGKK